ncbi:MAG: hypothetical protein KTR31_14175 [Myxococcales bacterium]|nr:hypothetical protein [Myxococcales bacterium]
MDGWVDWAVGTGIGGAGLLVVAYLGLEVLSGPSDIERLQQKMGSGATLFAAVSLPAAVDAEPEVRRELKANRRDLRGIVRWSEDGLVVVQTDTFRVRLDESALSHIDWGGAHALDDELFHMARDLMAEVRTGFANSEIVAVEPGELKGYLWEPLVQPYRVDLPHAWAEQLNVVIGLSAHDGRLYDVALTDAEGRPLQWRGHALRLTFDEEVAWGVPLGPDMVKVESVPLKFLGARTLWSDEPPQVPRDLPWHQRALNHPLALSEARSEGVVSAHLGDVVTAELPRALCEPEAAGPATHARMLWQSDSGVASFSALKGAVSSECELWFMASPQVSLVLDDAVTGHVMLTAAVTSAGRTVWEEQVGVTHTGGGLRLGRPVFEGQLPSRLQVEDLSFELSTTMSLTCNQESGEGQSKVYLTGIARPRVHWRCPVTEAPRSALAGMR